MKEVHYSIEKGYKANSSESPWIGLLRCKDGSLLRLADGTVGIFFEPMLVKQTPEIVQRAVAGLMQKDIQDGEI